MKVIGYARIRLSESGRDLSPQLTALKDAGCSRIFREEVFGPQPPTPEWERALASLQPGDRLVVWKLDRICRSLQQLVHVVNRLRAQRIQLLSLTEEFDTSGKNGASIRRIFAMLGDFELGLAQERARRGLACAILANRAVGRRPVMTQRKLAEALRFIAEGMSVRETAARLGVGKTALYDALRQQKSASANVQLKVADIADLIVLESSEEPESADGAAPLAVADRDR